MTVQMRPLETDRDTICALATAHGTGAISIVRISGVKAAEIVRKIAAFLPEKPESHKIYYGYLQDENEPIDEVLISYFAESRSFTGEESLEISCHGSDLLVDHIVRSLVASGARPARRGEFTYRAFMNGRIDLVQAESVLALIESRSARAAKQALRQLQGVLSGELHNILERLTWVMAHLEADIDFSTEDIEITASHGLVEKSQEILRLVKVLLASYRKGLMIRNGFQVALIGRPNVGKSSLLNALLGEDRAIVTPVAGTTRDFVQADLSVEGLRLTLIDTAGLHQSNDPVEKIGIKRTRDKLQDVDLLLLVEEASALVGENESPFAAEIPWEKTLLIVNKIDQCPQFEVRADLKDRIQQTLAVSAVTGQGVRELLEVFKQRLQQEVGEDSTLLSNARHQEGLQVLANSLESALPLMLNGESPDLIALELQSGLRALYEVLGMTFDDQVMDRVFAEFCLGK